MRVATLNIDWGNKHSSTTHFRKIEQFINQLDFDFLILTEGIKLNLQNFDYEYFSEQIAENIEYEELNYKDYLNGDKAFRTIIYSKIKSNRKYEVIDNKTSLAIEFETDFGRIVFYCSIIGTWYNRKPYAKMELENCLKDCKEIYKLNHNLIIVGDLNTSFLVNEKELTINEYTTESLKSLFLELNMFNATEKIEKNIDHIIIPKSMKDRIMKSDVFVEKGELSDHKGIYIELK